MVVKITRMEQQLARFAFGGDLRGRLAREWRDVQEECLGLVPGLPANQPVLPDGGDLDLDRLAGSIGSGYPALVRRWIGAEKLSIVRTSSRASRKGRGSRGGAEVPPEER